MPTPLTILPDPPPPPAPIGLIAGAGRLPVIIARGLKKEGRRLDVLSLSPNPDDELRELSDSLQRVGVLRVGSWGPRLRKRDVRHAIMVGRVDKASMMHNPWTMVRNIPDLRTAVAWYTRLRHDRRSHVLLAAVADELVRSGVNLIDSTSPIPDALAEHGVMTKRQPTAEQRADIAFGWPLLTEMLRHDIGQAIAVRDRDTIAVEAVEGTDRMIERAGTLCRGRDWTLCKGARAGHDRRSDVPTVGMTTIENLHEHGGRCLALAAGDVIMIDKHQMLRRADQLGIAVIGVTPAQL